MKTLLWLEQEDLLFERIIIFQLNIWQRLQVFIKTEAPAQIVSVFISHLDRHRILSAHSRQFRLLTDNQRQPHEKIGSVHADAYLLGKHTAFSHWCYRKIEGVTLSPAPTIYRCMLIMAVNCLTAATAH